MVQPVDFERVHHPGRRVFGDRINGHGGPEPRIANHFQCVLFRVIKAYDLRIYRSMTFQIIQHHPGPFEFVFEVRGVNPYQLIIF